MANLPYRITGYGLSEALPNIFPAPIIARRVPNTSDRLQVGQTWVYVLGNSVYTLTSVVNNLANWTLLGGAAGVLASLVVAPGPVSLTGVTTINTAGAASTTIATGGTGTLQLGNATGNTSVTGNLTATGTLTAGAGLSAVAGGVTAAAGNLTATNGNVVLSTAATFLQLPGPIRIRSGAGVPAGALGVNIGDVYVNTTAATAVTRLYICSAVGVWTNVTCAA